MVRLLGRRRHADRVGQLRLRQGRDHYYKQDTDTGSMATAGNASWDLTKVAK